MNGWRALESALGGTAAPEAPTAPFGDLEGAPALPGLGAQDPVVLAVMLNRLRQRDPGFDPHAFAAAAAQAFLAVEQAWTRLDPQLSRLYMSAALWSSHRARIELYQLHGRRNVLDRLAVRAAAVISVEQADAHERVAVRIDARSTDYDVDASGAVVRGTTALIDWREDWVFERDAGVLTAAGGGVLAQRCPNCGAPLELDAQACCTSCHAPVMDGSRDWVVVAVQRPEQEARMLQAVLGIHPTVPDPHDPLAPRFETTPITLPVTPSPGVSIHDATAIAVLRAADPDFDPRSLTDHATAAFSALRSAWAKLDTAPVRPYLDSSAESDLETAMGVLRLQRLTRLADDPLVDEVAIEHADDSDGFITVVVRVTAEIIDADIDASGTAVRGSRELQHVDERLTFRRHSGVASPGAGVVVLRCARCGAPLRAAGVGHCEYCHAAIADGGGDWALIDIGPMTPGTRHPAAAAALAAAPTTAPAGADPAAALLAADPSFNVHDFLAAARESFYAVERSVTQLDPAVCAGYLGDAMEREHNARIERLRTAHHHLVLAFLDLADCRLASVDPEGAPVVRFSITGQDSERDDASGAQVTGATAPHRWDEDWVFERASGDRPWRVRAISTAG